MTARHFRILVHTALAACLLSSPVYAADATITQSMKAFKAGNDATVVDTVTRALGSNALAGEDLARAYYYRGRAYHRQGRHAQSIADLTSALWLKGLGEPERIEAYKTRAAAYEATGLADRAAADLKSAGVAPAAAPAAAPVQPAPAQTAPTRAAPVQAAPVSVAQAPVAAAPARQAAPQQIKVPVPRQITQSSASPVIRASEPVAGRSGGGDTAMSWTTSEDSSQSVEPGSGGLGSFFSNLFGGSSGTTASAPAAGTTAAPSTSPGSARPATPYTRTASYQAPSREWPGTAFQNAPVANTQTPATPAAAVAPAASGTPAATPSTQGAIVPPAPSSAAAARSTAPSPSASGTAAPGLWQTTTETSDTAPGAGTGSGTNIGAGIGSFFSNLFTGGSTFTPSGPGAQTSVATSAAERVSQTASAAPQRTASLQAPGQATHVPDAVSTSSEPTTTAPVHTGKYHLQLAAVRLPAEAKAIVAKLLQDKPSALQGRKPEVHETVVGTMGTFYRVQLGPFASQKDTLQTCTELRRAGYDCFVIQ